jgi:hypothetical protein
MPPCDEPHRPIAVAGEGGLDDREADGEGADLEMRERFGGGCGEGHPFILGMKGGSEEGMKSRRKRARNKKAPGRPLIPGGQGFGCCTGSDWTVSGL